MTNIRILGRRNSVNVQKVMWTLGELALPYERVDVAGSFGFPDDYAAKNPNMVVPTLQDFTNGADLTVWESHACVRYLLDQYDTEHHLLPKQPQTRALADQWMEWLRGDYSAQFFHIFLNKIRLPADQAKPEMVDRGVAGCAKLYLQIDAHLANNSFMAGDEFSMGDIPLGAHSYRYFEMDIDRPSLPNVERWYQGLTEREAYQKHVMIPFGRNVQEWNEEERKNAAIQ